MLPIILGSSSRWRNQLLAEAGVEFQTMAPDIDEKAITHSDPKQLVLEIARAKSDALLQRIKQPVILITSDQVVTVNGTVYGKPESAAQAREYLNSYNQHPASTYTAVVLKNTQTGKLIELVDKVDITFHPIPEAVIEQAIIAGEIFDCAGAFQVENHKLSKYVDEINGDINSVKGLPTTRVLNALQQLSNFAH